MSLEIECAILDAKYEKDDYEVLVKLKIDRTNFEMLAWDGIEWSKKGLIRVYDNINTQNEYDEFISRLEEIEENKLLYEIVRELDENQSYYIENSRLYIYIESKKNS